MKHFYVRFLILACMMIGMVSACQKDQNVNIANSDKTAVKPDSIVKASASNASGNYLAAKGSLQIRIDDSIYTFDAVKDSIAIVNLNVSGQHYYGLTAINKAHNLSFGISSAGFPLSDVSTNIAGCQVLINTNRSSRQFTLSPDVEPMDIGAIKMDLYKQDSVLAKGTFRTFLLQDAAVGRPMHIIEGNFNLFIK